MKTKLTLTVDQRIIQRAKEYVGKNAESLSSVIEKFLENLAEKKSKRSAVDSSRGILKGKFTGMDDKKIRKEHYARKHGV